MQYIKKTEHSGGLSEPVCGARLRHPSQVFLDFYYPDFLLYLFLILLFCVPEGVFVELGFPTLRRRVFSLLFFFFLRAPEPVCGQLRP